MVSGEPEGLGLTGSRAFKTEQPDPLLLQADFLLKLVVSIVAWSLINNLCFPKQITESDNLISLILNLCLETEHTSRFMLFIYCILRSQT